MKWVTLIQKKIKGKNVHKESILGKIPFLDGEVGEKCGFRNCYLYDRIL